MRAAAVSGVGPGTGRSRPGLNGKSSGGVQLLFRPRLVERGQAQAGGLDAADLRKRHQVAIVAPRIVHLRDQAQVGQGHPVTVAESPRQGREPRLERREALGDPVPIPTAPLAVLDAKPVLQVAEDVLRARAAQAESDDMAAIEMWKKAAEAQDTIPYMEPPYWYYPVRQSLGAALLKTGKTDDAEKEFNAALAHARGSAWALYGLQQAAKTRGDAAAETKATDAFAKAWRGDPAFLTLERL